MSTPIRPEVALDGRLRQRRTPARTGRPRSWGVFAQGLAAAAPSVAVAVVPFSLFVAAGKGAAWAVLVGLAIIVLIAATISFQAKRTVSLDRWVPTPATVSGRDSPTPPGSACCWATSASPPPAPSAVCSTWIRSWSPSASARSHLVQVVVGRRHRRGRVVSAVSRGIPAAKYELVFELIAIASILVIIVGLRRLRLPDRLGAVESRTSRHQRHVHRGGDGGGLLRRFESVASLGAEAKDAHRNIARSLLRVVLLLGVLYIVATYPQVLFFDDIDGDIAVCRSWPMPPASRG